MGHGVKGLAEVEEQHVGLAFGINGARPVMNCLDKLGFGKEAFAEPMLIWVQYPMIFQVGEHAADYDMLLQLAYDGCEGYWPVVTRILLGSLIVNWRY